MSDEYIAFICVFCFIGGFLLVGRGCANDDNAYRLEKLRIERACPEQSPRVK